MARELELRTCGRAGCRWPAAASLSYRYDTRQVWLDDLTPEPHPALYDLCPHHADTLTVPRGWDRVDQREPREAVHEPSGHDLEVLARERAVVEREPARRGVPAAAPASAAGGVSAAAPAPAGVPVTSPAPAADGSAAAPAQAGGGPAAAPAQAGGGPAAATTQGGGGPAAEPGPVGGGNRYAALTADLPRLARKHGTRAPGSAASAAAGGRAAAPRRGESTQAPVPSRDLAPLPLSDRPPGPVAGGASGSSADGKHSSASVGDAPLRGQLALPIDDLAAVAHDGVVVSIESAGARRRVPGRT